MEGQKIKLNMGIKEGRPPSYYVKQRFKKNLPAVIGLWVILIACFAAVFCFVIIPDQSPMANDMSLSLSTRKPGFGVDILKVKKNKEPEQVSFMSRIFEGKEDEYREIPIDGFELKDGLVYYREFSGLEGDTGWTNTISLADVFYAIQPDEKIVEADGKLAFKLYDGSDAEYSVSELAADFDKRAIEHQTFWFGTDRYGRDMLSRLVAGSRVSLSVGFISVAISLIIGVFLGAAGGFFRGRVDRFVMGLINVVWSIPTLLLVIAITMALGKGFWQVFVAVGLTTWVEVARVVRGQILGIRELEYVEAAKALGFRSPRIIFKHILPNITGPVIVICASNFAGAILLEAGLSFLGLGAQPPMPSWGMMIKENYGYIVVDAAYLAFLPGLAIMIMVLAFTFVGSGLRDALDPKEAANYLP